MLTFSSSFASVLKCQAEEDSISVVIPKNYKSSYTLEIYSQGGLGPNFLESSFESNSNSENVYGYTPDDDFYLEADFSEGCSVKVFYNLHKRQKMEDGSYVNSDGKTIPLTNCEISYYFFINEIHS
jgi:hypothetical protein